MVYVLAKNGSPLMPAENHGYVRILPRSHREAPLEAHSVRGGSSQKLVHTDSEWVARLSEKKTGMNKKYGALSVLNQIIPSLVTELSSIPGLEVMVTNGRSTKAFRDAHGIAKDHHIDAYCIACSVLNEGITVDPPDPHCELRRFRRHDRAAASRKEERKYYQDGKIAAKNRNKRMDLKDDSLAEFCLKHPEDVENLTVVKGVVKYKNPKRILPGAIYLVYGDEMVLQGRHGKRKDEQANYFEFVKQGNFTLRQCRYLSRGGGWQFI